MYGELWYWQKRSAVAEKKRRSRETTIVKIYLSRIEGFTDTERRKHHNVTAQRNFAGLCYPNNARIIEVSILNPFLTIKYRLMA
jgi:hypothetical protein